jgi:hypothetical protein
MTITRTEIPHARCPYCGVKHDVATAQKAGDRPGEGSVSVCIECGEISMFTRGMRLRKVTTVEMTELQRQINWPDLEALARGVKAFRAVLASLSGSKKD